MMNTKDYLRYIAEEIHTTIIATVDDEGLPVTCAIDIMNYDDNHLYFLTAKGKAFYHRLLQRGYIALTGLKGKDTMHCVSVSVQGKVEDIGEAMLPRLFEKNPCMNDIYPTRASRQALTVFRVYDGNGEWFDLSQKPIERASFTFGAAQKAAEGYFITESCTGCRSCEAVCPQHCIDFSTTPAVILSNHCLHCGNCMTVCTAAAVVKG